MAGKVFKVKLYGSEENFPDIFIDLPLTEEEIVPIQNRECEIMEVFQGPVLREMIRPGEKIQDLNFLAKKIGSLSKEQFVALEGLLEFEQELHGNPLHLGMTCFLSCHAGECEAFPDIRTPLELGRFLYMNGMLTQKTAARVEATEEGSKLQDSILRRQGKNRQERREGKFVSRGYMEPDPGLLHFMVDRAVQEEIQTDHPLQIGMAP